MPEVAVQNPPLSESSAYWFKAPATGWYQVAISTAAASMWVRPMSRPESREDALPRYWFVPSRMYDSGGVTNRLAVSDNSGGLSAISVGSVIKRLAMVRLSKSDVCFSDQPIYSVSFVGADRPSVSDDLYLF